MNMNNNPYTKRIPDAVAEAALSSKTRMGDRIATKAFELSCYDVVAKREYDVYDFAGGFIVEDVEEDAYWTVTETSITEFIAECHSVYGFIVTNCRDEAKHYLPEK